MAEPFTPITKEHAAEICSVSLRTINYWIEAGDIPAPTSIASGRRLYWHPDVFYEWLKRELGVTGAEVTLRKQGRPRNTLH